MQHSNWICPQCGLPDISGDRVQCPSCGKKRNRWGYWDCASCQTKSIRADHKECPNCGRPRARNVKFYLRDDLVEFVDEVSGQNAVRINRPNWICPYCNQQNDDAVDVCVYCNAARTESKERYHDVETPQQTPPAQTFPKVQRKKDRTTLVCCLLVLIPFVLFFGFAAILAIWQSVSSKKVRTATEYETYWTSTVFIEEFRTFEDSDWELPADARLIRTAEEDYTYIDHYERRSREIWVDDDDDDWDNDDWGGGWDDGGWDDGGWADYGDGQFGVFRIPTLICGAKAPSLITLRYETEYYDEPVYATVPRTKYYYEYDAWVDSRTVTANGTPGTEPYYESFSLEENERERTREIRWYVDFQHDDEPVTIELSKAEYDRISGGSELRYRCDVTDGFDNPQYILADDQG